MKHDENTSMQDFRDLSQKFVQERNWESYHTPRALAEAISIEAAELLENFLFSKSDLPNGKIESVTDEMADIFLYLMNLCNVLNIPSFSQKIYDKMAKNRQKYPIEKFHGDQYKKQ